MFCTDFAWVNINPILNVFLKTTIGKYLDEKFDEFISGTVVVKPVLIGDKLHFIKMLLGNSRKIAPTNVIAETFVCVILKFLTIKNKENVKRVWRHIVNVFCNMLKDQDSLKIVEEMCVAGKGMISEECNEDEPIIDLDNEDELATEKGIKKKSKFFTYFSKVREECCNNMLENDTNGKKIT